MPIENSMESQNFLLLHPTLLPSLFLPLSFLLLFLSTFLPPFLPCFLTPLFFHLSCYVPPSSSILHPLVIFLYILFVHPTVIPLNLQFSLYIITIIKLWKMRPVEHVACMKEMRNIYKIFARKPKRERSFGKWEDNIKLAITKIMWEGVT